MPVRIVCAAFALLFLPVAGDAARAQSRIEWKLNEGDEFYLENTVAMKQSQKIMGQEIEKSEFEVAMLNRFKVLKNNADGGWLVERKVEAVKIKNPQSAGQTGAILKQFEGSTFRITFASNFRVLKQEGYEELIKKLAGQDAVAGRMARSMLPEDTLRSELEETFAFMPEKPVSAGDRWDRRYVRSLGPVGSLVIVKTHQYDGTEMEGGKKVEKVLVSPAITHSATKPGGGALQFPTQGTLKAENARGQLLFDAQAGRLVLSELSFRLRGNLTTTVNMNMLDIEVDMEQSIRVRGFDKRPMEK